jgi:Bacterial SH3 domain
MPRSTSPSFPSVALVAARYELVRELRVGSQAVDWEAVDTALDRHVVVQLLRPELAHDTAATERFWQEARAAARRTTAVGNRVLDAGTDPESRQPFVVREWAVSPPSPADVRPSHPNEPGAVAQLVNGLHGSPSRFVLWGVVLGLILVVGALTPAVEGWLAWVNEPSARVDRSLGFAPAVVAVPSSGAQPGQSTATPAAPPPTVAPAVRSAPPAPTVATPSPTRAANVTPLPAGQTRRIVNTDGRGVALRTQPGGDRQPGKGYDEGVTVQVLEQSGQWTHIRGSDGREGWVLTVTLAP